MFLPAAGAPAGCAGALLVLVAGMRSLLLCELCLPSSCLPVQHRLQGTLPLTAVRPGAGQPAESAGSAKGPDVQQLNTRAAVWVAHQRQREQREQSRWGGGVVRVCNTRAAGSLCIKRSSAWPLQPSQTAAAAPSWPPACP